MSPNPLAAKAEIEKIARLLNANPEELDYLLEVDAEALAELRDQVTDRLFAAGAQLFGKLGAASRIVPAPVAATISQKAFGPLMTARMSTVADPSAAIAVAKRLDPKFLADVATYMDPRRAPQVISGLPADLIVSASVELEKREEWVTMGRFVGELELDVIAATVEALSDEALLRIAFVTEQPDRLAVVLDEMPDERIEGMVTVALELGLQAETEWLLETLGDKGGKRIAAALQRRAA